MPSILADFTRLHRGAALPLDLTDDRPILAVHPKVVFGVGRPAGH